MLEPGDLLNSPLRDAPFAVVDLEMTGLDAARDRICEIGIVLFQGGRVLREFQTLVRPPIPISKGARKVVDITEEELAEAPVFAEVADAVRDLLAGAIFVAHNVPFDLGYLHREFELLGTPLEEPVSLDTLLVARRLFAFRRNNLANICKELKIPLEGHHRALADARATVSVLAAMLEMLDPLDQMSVEDLADLVGALAPNSPLRVRQKHQLREAFRLRSTVRIGYVSTGKASQVVVDREIGIWKLKLPYLQAWCYLRSGERVFRLDRIRTVAPGEQNYEVPTFKSRI